MTTQIGLSSEYMSGIQPFALLENKPWFYKCRDI